MAANSRLLYGNMHPNPRLLYGQIGNIGNIGQVPDPSRQICSNIVQQPPCQPQPIEPPKPHKKSSGKKERKEREKKYKKSYKKSDMKKAVAAVRDGTLRAFEAAKKFNVPPSTLGLSLIHI